MTDAVDLDAYFDRIGYTGSREPRLETLRAIHLRHVLTIPFENLDPLLRRPVRLDLPSLETKIVRGGRGGYCFEQNMLLSRVLQALGFEVTPLAARVVWNAPPDMIGPRTHMLLRIDLADGPYVADVGFGGLSLTAPLRLAADIEQQTPHETFRLLKADDSFVIQALIRGTWSSLYRFTLDTQLLPDFEMANWYMSTHPQSRMVSGLLVARPANDRRYALFNNQLSVHHPGGTSEQRLLKSAGELRKVLQETFLLAVPEEPALNDVLDRITAQTA